MSEDAPPTSLEAVRRERNIARCAELFERILSREVTVKEWRERIEEMLRWASDKQMNGNRPCDHVTLRAPWLPCPHPECWTMPTARIFRFERAHRWLPTFTAWTRDGLKDLGLWPAVEREVWLCERKELSLAPGETYWGWRRT